MFRKAARFIDKLPFAGKHVIRPTLKSYVRSDLGHERLKFAGTCLFLGGFALAHASGAVFGVTTFTEQLQNFEHSPNASDLGNLAIDATYAAAMGAVSLRQLSLLPAVNRIRKHRDARYTRRRIAQAQQDASMFESGDALGVDQHAANETGGTSTTDFYVRRNLGAIGLTLAITVGGQVAMAESASTAAREHFQQTCIRDADNDLAVLEQADPSDVSRLAFYQREWASSCVVDFGDIRPVLSTPPAVAASLQP
ncbi:MAG TPA: hypothetical protein VLG92_01385 [Candidatus Saccharimonadia bacterium]|nr:hypothetical protein [Candidatus Saccharimonadia bacterium]